MNDLIGNLLSMWTIVVAIVFAGIVIWAFSSRRKAEFDAAARIPLEQDSDDRIPS
jgi:cytochrome c oxidase cbb3-type subunit 4